MDRQFLEFMGNLMLSVAKGRKHLEDMVKWMGCGLAGPEDISALFGKFYGLEGPRKDRFDHQKAWTAAMELFSASFREYMALFGAVPREDHLSLLKRVEGLEERVASQDETIRRLRVLLADAGREECRDMAGHFQDLVQKQAEQFQELMDSLGQVFRAGAPHSEE